MVRKNLVELLEGENPPGIRVFWKQNAIYRRRCKIRIPSEKAGFGWIPKLFLPWRHAEEYCEYTLELEMFIDKKYGADFLHWAQRIKGIPNGFDIPADDDIDHKKWLIEQSWSNFDEYIFNEDEGEEISRLEVHQSDEGQPERELYLYLGEWQYEKYHGLKNQPEGEKLDHWFRESQDMVWDKRKGNFKYVGKNSDVVLRPENLKFFSNRSRGGGSLSGGLWLDDFELISVSEPFDTHLAISRRKNSLSEEEFVAEILKPNIK